MAITNLNTLGEPATPPRSTSSRGPVTDPIEAVSHTVQSGENFWTIARLYYGSGRFYSALWKANADQFPTPEALTVGATIRIPPPEALDRAAVDKSSNVEPSFARAGAEVADRTTRPAPSATKPQPGLVDLPRPDKSVRTTQSNELIAGRDIENFEGRYHIVSDGAETFRSIARDELGNSRRADEIRNLNLDVMGDRSRLQPGMRLRLPADAGERTIRR